MANTFYEDTEERKRLLPQALGTNSPAGVLTQNVKPGTALPMTMRARLGKVYEDLDKLDSQEPDMSALQAFARQQGESGQSSMLNALAAQYAGESFQPLQAQFLKRAAAASDPLKVNGGILTPDGQFLRDPFARADSRRTQLERQATGLEGMIQQQERSEQARQDRLAQQDATNQFRQIGLDLQRQGLDIRRDNAGKEDPYKQFRNEDNLRGDFDRQTKDLREELNATSKITQIVSATPPGKRPDAITQQSLVILLNKFLDPGSVVREGEFDRVVKAQGLEGRAANLKNYLLKGEPLNDEAIRQINDLAGLYSRAAETKIKSVASNYTEIAKKRGLDVGSVISDPRYRQVTVDY